MKNKKKRGLLYSRGEERLNTWTHALGIALAVGVGVWFLIRCGQLGEKAWATLSVWLYLFGMASSYIASTLYHALRHRNPWKRRLRHWDHAAIYWHIAGSYSPITLMALREVGLWGWGLFVFVWLCAVGGTIASFRRLSEHSHLETVCFVVMGLSVLVAFKPLLDYAPGVSVGWIVAEGVAYITGAAFYSVRRVRYMHSVFHFFVLLGSVCHIIAVWEILCAMS